MVPGLTPVRKTLAANCGMSQVSQGDVLYCLAGRPCSSRRESVFKTTNCRRQMAGQIVSPGRFPNSILSEL